MGRQKDSSFNYVHHKHNKHTMSLYFLLEQRSSLFVCMAMSGQDQIEANHIYGRSNCIMTFFLNWHVALEGFEKPLRWNFKIWLVGWYNFGE